MSTVDTRGLLLTVAEAAERLRLSERTVRRLIERRQLPALRIGASIRISEAELQSVLRPAHEEDQ